MEALVYNIEPKPKKERERISSEAIHAVGLGMTSIGKWMKADMKIDTRKDQIDDVRGLRDAMNGTIALLRDPSKEANDGIPFEIKTKIYMATILAARRELEGDHVYDELDETKRDLEFSDILGSCEVYRLFRHDSGDFDPFFSLLTRLPEDSPIPPDFLAEMKNFGKMCEIHKQELESPYEKENLTMEAIEKIAKQDTFTLREIDLTIVPADDRHDTVAWSSFWLDSLLKNLMTNLEKASLKSGQEHPKLTIRFEKNPDGTMTIIFTDNAGGYPQDLLYKNGFDSSSSANGYGFYNGEVIPSQGKGMDIHDKSIKKFGGRFDLANVPVTDKDGNVIGTGAELRVTIPLQNREVVRAKHERKASKSRRRVLQSL